MPKLPPRLDPSDPVQGFALKLRVLRLRAGDPALAQLARVMSCSHSTVSAYLNGRRLPPSQQLEAFVRACGGDPVVWLNDLATVRSQLGESREINRPELTDAEVTISAMLADAKAELQRLIDAQRSPTDEALPKSPESAAGQIGGYSESATLTHDVNSAYGDYAVVAEPESPSAPSSPASSAAGPVAPETQGGWRSLRDVMLGITRLAGGRTKGKEDATLASTTSLERRPSVEIGIFGPPGSGRSTYLASLYVAVTRATRSALIFGVDDRSTDFLIDNTRKITQDKVFPISGQRDPPLDFTLRISSSPGTDLHLTNDGDGLPGFGGMILMFDPLREIRKADNYLYWQRAFRMMSAGRYSHERLPHYVAVCVTKFDHPNIFQAATSNGYVSFPSGQSVVMPWIDDGKARDFLLSVAGEESNSDLAVALVEHYFSADRIRYFASSSIGFEREKNGRLSLRRVQNVMAEDVEGEVPDRIYPVNVLEPLEWLARETPTFTPWYAK